MSNVKCSVDEIRLLCNSHDVVLLQETWLYSIKLNVLADIDNTSHYQYVSFDFLRPQSAENLHVTDVECLGNDSYTFISYAHNTGSWLDHIVTTSDGACFRY